MAFKPQKIVITIEDLGDSGRVGITMEPKFSEIITVDVNGGKLTPAHGYALRIANECLKMSKENEPTKNIWLPKARRV